MESGRADACAASARAIAGLLGWSPSIRVDVPHLPESLSYESNHRDLSRVEESVIGAGPKIFCVDGRATALLRRDAKQWSVILRHRRPPAAVLGDEERRRAASAT